MKNEVKTKNIWSVLCKRLIVDDQTKLMTLVDIVERLILDIDIEKVPEEHKVGFKDNRFQKPIQIPDNITVASYWLLQKEHRGVELNVETIIIDDTSKKLASGEISFKTDKEHTNYRTFFTLPSFPITGKGIYNVKSILKDKKGEVLAKSELPITIDLNIVKPPLNS